MREKENSLGKGLLLIAIYLFSICLFVVAETTEQPSVSAILGLADFVFRIYGPVILLLAIGVAIYLIVKKIFRFKSPEPFDDSKTDWAKSIVTVEQGVRSTSKAVTAIAMLALLFFIMWIRILLWAVKGI